MLIEDKNTVKAREEQNHADFYEAQTRLFDLSNQFYELSTPTDFAFD